MSELCYTDSATIEEFHFLFVLVSLRALVDELHIILSYQIFSLSSHSQRTLCSIACLFICVGILALLMIIIGLTITYKSLLSFV